MSSNPFGDNPYQTPPPAPGGFGQGPGSGYALAKVQGPAIAMMVLGGVGILLCLVGVVLNLVNIGGAAAAVGGNQPEGQQAFLMANGAFGIVQALVGIVISALAIYAGLQMKNLRAYQLSFIASIAVMLPCVSPCCIIGLPIGIWSLVVLNDPAVKSSFQ